MKNETVENIEFQIKSIEILDSYLKTPKHPIVNDVTFQFDMSLEHRIDLEKKFIIVLTNVSCFVDQDQGELSRFKSSCIYYLPELDKYFDEKSSNINLPNQFVTSINSISISTTRGLLFSFLKGTFLHNAVIPIINPASFKLENNYK